MKQTLTSKQSMFCDLIAKGKSQVEAYTTAYNCKTTNKDSIKANANKLMNNQDIQARLKELKQISEQDIKYTKEQSFKRLCEMQEKAKQENNLNAMIRAEELKGKLFDLYNNKSNININADINSKVETIRKFNIIYSIDKATLQDLIAGKEDNIYVKKILENLKRTDTALITSEQVKQIQEQDKSNTTFEFDLRLEDC